MKIKIKTLSHFDSSFSLPGYKTAEAAGADIQASFSEKTKIIIKPMERVLIPTGLAFEIPAGFEIQVRPRSGLSLKTGLLVVNSPGTIDSDYRGELQVIMGNLSDKEEIINHGDRIAQIILAPILQAEFEKVENLQDSVRGAGGFGSTGLK